MEKLKYIEEVKKLLLEDLNSKSDISPNGMYKIYKVSDKYNRKVDESTIKIAMDQARWLETYFMNCRHMNRPIDEKLAEGLIDLITYI